MAEVRPVNWRKYCASPGLPRLEGDADSPGSSTPASGEAGAPAAEPSAGTGAEEQRTTARNAGDGGDAAAPAAVSGGNALLEQCGALPPVCLLFALCEKGCRGDGRSGIAGAGGASELEPLLWQLLELTLRPDNSSAAVPPPPPGSPRQRGSGGGGSSSANADAFASVSGVFVDAKRRTEQPGAGGSSPARDAVDKGPVAQAGEGPGAGAVASGDIGGDERARSPAELLIAQGLVGPDALVKMAQNLLSPVTSADARKRTARVLHHLWAASSPASRPEVCV